MKGKLIVNEPSQDFITFLKNKKIKYKKEGSHITVKDYKLGSYNKVIGLYAIFITNDKKRII